MKESLSPSIAGTLLESLPSTPGTYALLFRPSQPLTVTPGALGVFRLPPGLYAYLGSALGPGGIRARIQYHLRGRQQNHWHVDWLTQTDSMEAVCWVSGAERLECTWLQLLLPLAGSRVRIPGFGSTDCRRGCPSHLVELAPDSGVENAQRVICTAGISALLSLGRMPPKSPLL